MTELSEVDRIMQRSESRNVAARKRIAANKARRESTAKKAETVDALLKRNWSFLYKNITAARTTLSSIDAGTEPLLRGRLQEAKANLNAVMNRMQEQNITRLSKHNVRSQIGYVINAVEGMRHGLQEQTMPRSRVASLLPKLCEQLEAVSQELEVRVDRERLDIANADFVNKHRAVEEAKRRAQVADSVPANKRKFVSMQEAMELVRDSSQENIRALEREARAAVAPEQKETWEIRDQKNMSEISKQFPDELRAMRAAVAKSGIEKADDVKFVFMRGPIVIRTSPQISEDKLRKAGVEYRIVSFPGVAMGWRGGMTGMGGGKREYLPHMFILLDQVLVGFGRKVQRATTANSKPSRLPVLRTVAKPLESKADMGLLRRDVCDILQTRTGTPYIDVLQESTGGNEKYVTSKHFPGMKLVWLLRRSVYQKIGPFSIDEVGLPF